VSLIAKFASLGFNKLTEIQKQAIPKILEQKNSLIIAPTGSGKTECSVIPVFSQIRKSKIPGKIKMLYITPLRALNRDVFRRIIDYGKIDGLDIKIRHGDTSQANRKKISDSPPDVLITTPETLVVLLSQRKYLSALSHLEWVVIDEVHELLPSERGSQLAISMERLQLTLVNKYIELVYQQRSVICLWLLSFLLEIIENVRSYRIDQFASMM